MPFRTFPHLTFLSFSILGITGEIIHPEAYAISALIGGTKGDRMTTFGDYFGI